MKRLESKIVGVEFPDGVSAQAFVEEMRGRDLVVVDWDNVLGMYHGSFEITHVNEKTNAIYCK